MAMNIKDGLNGLSGYKDFILRIETYLKVLNISL